ncbi:hypothetical protein P4B35_16505 [Pontiellaceae bacterium B12227]|nr:hypothetical protein [Pontiellaceae bacterium B12227]
MFKVIGSVLTLGGVILTVFHLVMLYGLTQAMRDVVLPRLKQETGLNAKVGRLSINVAAGKLFLNDVAVLNPEGFVLENMASVDRIEVSVDVKSLLLQNPLIVKRVEMENALVNVIRNQSGEINFNKLEEKLPPGKPVEPGPVPEPGKFPPEPIPTPGKPVPVEQPKPLPELLFERMQCTATVRYLDFNLDELDIALSLDVKAVDLSTVSGPDAKWGAARIIGALGNDHNSYQTDLSLRLAPIRDTEVWSFDLTGRVMEIDPRSLESLYKRAGIRTAPFGIEPQFSCRENRFEKSQLRISLTEVELEEKLSRKLGGIGTIDQLELMIPVAGTLDKPVVDFQQALMSAIGSNTGSLFDAWIRGQVEKQSGKSEAQPSVMDAAVEALGKEVSDIGENETLKKVLKDLADGEPSATNQPAPISTDTLIDMLGEEVKEIGENEELKKELKNLGKWLLGE